MRQRIDSEHLVDKDGNPAGGESWGMGIDIEWQNGPLGRGPDRKDPNGAFVEGVIEAALDRLRFFESTKFACEENAGAILCLEDALRCLDERTRRRGERGVEGTHEP